MRILFIIFLTLFPLQTLLAEVYECNGVYSNVPCEQQKKELQPAGRLSQDEINRRKQLSRKKSLLHELSMTIIKAKREYKLDYDMQIVEDYCLEAGTTPIECNSKVNELSEKIENRISTLENIKAQQKANQLKEEQIKAEREASQTNVTIVRHPVFIIHPTPTPIYIKPKIETEKEKKAPSKKPATQKPVKKNPAGQLKTQ